MNKFKIGDRAWSIQNPFMELEEVEIVSEQQKEYKGVTYYQVQGVVVKANFCVCVSDLFVTKQEAVAESNRRNKKRIKEISSSINSTKDLLNMMLKCMHEETREDQNYIEVAKNKAKELLGVELQGGVL